MEEAEETIVRKRLGLLWSIWRRVALALASPCWTEMLVRIQGKSGPVLLNVSSSRF